MQFTQEKRKAKGELSVVLTEGGKVLTLGNPILAIPRRAFSDKEDGRLEVREIFGMDLKANLVVLSGCETGLGKLSTGDELVGLTRAFVYAGTPSVMASLWKVDDSSTAALMGNFYRNLKP